MNAVLTPFELTRRQAEAVAYRGGNMLLEAVPGSGKTRVIVARCAALIESGVPAPAILIITFSRRAVGELRTRLTQALPAATLPDIHTFHGFAARLLAEAGPAGRSRRLLCEPADKTIFERAVRSTALLSLPAGVRQSRAFRDAAADYVAAIRRSSAEHVTRLTEFATPRIADLLELSAQQTLLRDRLGVADYDDLVARAVLLAQTSGSSTQTTLRRRYRHALVDEFQDTDRIQLALLEQLHAEIFAVGDTAQAIYGFRGAARDALDHAGRVLGMHTLPLDESFRCPASICELARSVWPAPPRLQSRIDAAGEITYRRAASQPDEAALIAETVAAALAAGTPDREIAVLVRSVEPLARLVEHELQARGIVASRQGEERVVDDLAVDAVRAALAALAEPTNNARWTELAGHPAFGVAPLPLRLALASIPGDVEGVCDRIASIAAPARVSGPQLAAALRSAQAWWIANEPARAARAFAFEANVLGFVAGRSEIDAQRSSRRLVAFLDALSDVHEIRRRLDPATSAAASFEAFLAASQTWNTAADDGADEPGVRILTVHAAKGLEFDCVIIADAVEGHFPASWRPDALLDSGEIETARACGVGLGTRLDEHLAQERALWYVAVTRSKHALVVTWSESSLEDSPQRPSRFVPLEARTGAAGRPSFRGPLSYVPAPFLVIEQPPAVARLNRPVQTRSIETWLSCRRRFFYDALLRIGRKESGFAAKLGTLVHRTIERFHADVRDFRTVTPGAHANWTIALHAIARSMLISECAFETELERSAALRAADRLLERYARSLETAAQEPAGGFEVAATERSVSYQVDGVALSGRIDRVDRNAAGRLTLVDVKTGAFKKEKSMLSAFPKLQQSIARNDVWVKGKPEANPQLALYRQAVPATAALQYVYLGAQPKFGAFHDAAQTDRLDVTSAADVLTAFDDAIATIFFKPWTTGGVTDVVPTQNSRTCRRCEFISVCPGYLEDDD